MPPSRAPAANGRGFLWPRVSPPPESPSFAGTGCHNAAPVLKIKKAANWSYSLSHSGSSPMSGFLPALSLAASAGYSSAIRHSSLAASLVLAGRALRANRGKFGRVPVSSDLSRPLLGSHYKFVTEATLFELDTHKEPTFSDLYLIHQQGWQGAAEHVSHPDRIAWKSMCATDEGREKGENGANELFGRIRFRPSNMFGNRSTI